MRKLTALLASIALAFTLTIGYTAAEVATDTAPTTEAAFSNCNWLMDVSWRAASLQCWTNTGPWWASYRAVLKCSDGSVHRGPWRNNGSWSRTGTVCPWSGSGVAKWMETTG